MKNREKMFSTELETVVEIVGGVEISEYFTILLKCRGKGRHGELCCEVKCQTVREFIVIGGNNGRC